MRRWRDPDPAAAPRLLPFFFSLFRQRVSQADDDMERRRPSLAIASPLDDIKLVLLSFFHVPCHVGCLLARWYCWLLLQSRSFFGGTRTFAITTDSSLDGSNHKRMQLSTTRLDSCAKINCREQQEWPQPLAIAILWIDGCTVDDASTTTTTTTLSQISNAKYTTSREYVHQK